jgi:hypothetical protein
MIAGHQAVKTMIDGAARAAGVRRHDPSTTSREDHGVGQRGHPPVRVADLDTHERCIGGGGPLE